VQAFITLEQLGHYEAWLPLNSEGMYRQISLYRRLSVHTRTGALC